MGAAAGNGPISGHAAELTSLLRGPSLPVGMFTRLFDSGLLLELPSACHRGQTGATESWL